MTIEMMNNNWYAPNINLDNIDERCAKLDYITGNGREMANNYTMSNNFAFGGINTSLIFKTAK
jgi:3-oxoacyl-[acyl-carrier-protein] synthase II